MEHRGFYGSPRIHQELRAAGHPVGRHRVARLMHRAELRARTRKAFRPCSRASSGAAGGLDAWIDLFSRRVVGWKLDHRMDAALVIEALNRALGLRRVEPKTLLLHTDQGSQYRATDYRDLLRKREIVCSMSAKGCCWDNAVVESFSPPSSSNSTSMTIEKS